MDLPTKRKIHSKPTAYVGGLGVSIILQFAIIFFDNFDPHLSLIITIGFLVAILGFVDDNII